MCATQQLPRVVRPLHDSHISAVGKVGNCQSSNKLKLAQVKTSQKRLKTVPLSDQHKAYGHFPVIGEKSYLLGFLVIPVLPDSH